MPRVPTFCQSRKALGGVEGKSNAGIFKSGFIFLGNFIETKKKPCSRNDILTQRIVTFQISLLVVDCEWHEEREEKKYFVLDEVTRLCFANVSNYV